MSLPMLELMLSGNEMTGYASLETTVAILPLPITCPTKSDVKPDMATQSSWINLLSMSLPDCDFLSSLTVFFDEPLLPIVEA